ncbi:MAG: chorismate synthase [Lentisphaerae bacterium]|nr:chorismate synthase [Lentisphaerota bacterium]
MPGSSFGTLFRVTTFGESHGGAVGVVVDGVTPGLPLCEADIQAQLDRRRPGQSAVTTPRQETDTVQLLSGVFEGRATGTPVMMMVHNRDQQPEAYAELKDLFRPGHADYTYLRKYGLRDHRGSGRASGRETIGRVAAGAIARKQLAQRGVRITACCIRAAGIACSAYDPDEIERNIVRAADREAARLIVEKILAAREAHDSIGGVVECRVEGVPAGLGDPVFDKLDADLGKAVLSIGAIKGVEFGAGFAAADMAGSQHNDAMDRSGFLSNHAGGIIGGISTGAEIVFRVVFKPTASIARPQRTVDVHGHETTCETHGRHDPAVFPRGIPVVEAMTAIVLEDHFKRQAALHA